jgi:hypothetical protein
MLLACIACSGVSAAAAVAAPPGAPASLLTPADDPSGTAVLVDEPQFSWSPSVGAAAYELQISPSELFRDAPSILTKVARYQPTATLTQDVYHWRVRAIGADGSLSAWSRPSSFRREWLAPAPAGDPDGPGLRAARPLMSLTDADPAPGVQLPANQLTFRWSAVRGASYYVVDISTEPTFMDKSLRRSCRTPHTTLTPYGGAHYSGTPVSRFGTCNIAGPDDAAPAAPVVPAPAAPVVPAPAAPVVPAPAAPVVPAPAVVPPAPPAVASPAGPFIHSGPTYWIRVRAVNESRDGVIVTSLWSNNTRPGAKPGSGVSASFSVIASARAETPRDAPAVPIAQSAPAPSPDTPLLTWQPVQGASYYLVALAKDSSFNTTALEPDSLDLRPDDYVVTTNTELILNQGMLDNTWPTGFYWFVLPCDVAAISACVGSAQAINIPGHFATFTKLGLPVSGLAHTQDPAGVLELRWTDQLTTSPDGGGVTYYEVEVKDRDGKIVDDVKTDNTHFIPAAGTYPDGDYSWRVRAVDASGTPLEWSAADTFRTPAGRPLTPGSTTTVTLKGAQVVGFGRGAELAGQLTDSAGYVIGGAEVAIEALASGTTTWQPAGRAVTTSAGGFVAVVSPQRNTRYRARFVGDLQDPPGLSPTLSVDVAPEVSVRVKADRLTGAKRLTFTGRILPARASTTLQVRCRHGQRWVTISTARVSAAGTYRTRLRTTARNCRVELPASTKYAKARSREGMYVAN